MQRAMAREAEAEREERSTIIAAEGAINSFFQQEADGIRPEARLS